MQNINMSRGKQISKTSLLITLVSALFLALSPPYLGALLPLIFVIPIYMAIHGVKAGKKSGMYISLGILPLAFAVSVLWINYFLAVYKNLHGEFLSMSSQYHISLFAAKILILGAFTLSFILGILSIISFIFIMKNRKNFK
ncbi:hypothetical protein [Clostridium ganghwense]|uniref:DUF4199 domain-containing protein n=1 Tax=Clostridium ganghwense TaxID=312089 RepID=A0ABT4CN15_9CLOT|nr:hypothetical protein [Clostridium ganghwense]MCY6370444.1 hypothetical protein [Clostridium ganghwense]